MTILFTLILLLPTYAPDYSPLLLPQLLDGADLIAHIQVTQVLEEEIEGSVRVVLKGSYSARTIRIKKFQDWTCAQRWTSYAVGQEEIVFLRQKENGLWAILGAGNEGEMPIEKGKLYYKSPIYLNPYITSEQWHFLSTGKIYGTVYERDVAIHGIRAYFDQEDQLNSLLSHKAIIGYYPHNAFFKRAVDELIIRNSFVFSEAELQQRVFEEKGKR